MNMAKINVDYLQSTYFTFDRPVDFKGLKIKPIKVEDWITFSVCVSVFDLDEIKAKNTDIEVIQMSYMKWLLWVSMVNQEIGEDIIPKIKIVFDLCFDIEQFDMGFDGANRPYIVVNGVLLNAKDFEEFRKIIIVQNMYDYEDESGWSEDFKEAMVEYRQYMNKGIISPSLERQIVILANERHCMESDIHKMSYRKFKMAIDEIKGKLDYQIYKTAENSGMVTFKQPIDDWLYKRERNKYADMMTDFDDYKEKIEGANG